jgi:cyclophilin family peptidyl-prolyl cis-trans isomerase
MAAKKNPHVFFDVKIGSKEAGRIEFELFADTTPRTAENFRCLCTGEKSSKHTPRPLTFKNSIFHRIIAGFMAQGGDFTAADGTGGMSIYGPTFADENFIKRHNTSYLLSMANAGKNTNASQFFITFRATPHLDGKHVVFGRVTRGTEIVKALEHVPTDRSERPLHECFISNCGEITEQDAAAAQVAVAVAKAKAAKPDNSEEIRIEGFESSDEEDEDTKTTTAATTATTTTTDKKATTQAKKKQKTGGKASTETAQQVEKDDEETPAASTATATATSATNTKSKKRKATQAADEEEEAAVAEDAEEVSEADAMGVPKKPQTEMEKKLAAIKEKMNAARKETKREVQWEQKRITKKGKGGKKGGGASDESKPQSDYREAAEAWAAEMKENGEDPDKPFLYESAGAVQMRLEKKAKKKDPNSSGLGAFNSDALYSHFKKRVAVVRSKPAESALAVNDRDANTLTYGTDGRPADVNIDHMVEELRQHDIRRANYSRRRAFNEDSDVNYINERNRVFNKKVQRFYDKYTQEIKNNIERGTAL